MIQANLQKLDRVTSLKKMITLYAFSGDIAHTQINYFKMEMLHEPYDTLQLQISKSIQI